MAVMPVDAVDGVVCDFLKINVFTMDVSDIEPGFLCVGTDDLQVVECTEFLKFSGGKHRADGILRGKEEAVDAGIDVVADEVKRGRRDGSECMVDGFRDGLDVFEQAIRRSPAIFFNVEKGEKMV